MDALISEILKMDNRAKQAVEDAEKSRDTAKAAIVKEKENIYNNLTEDAAKKLERAKSDSKNKLDKMIIELEKQFDNAINALDEQYKANKDRWIANITQSVLFDNKGG